MLDRLAATQVNQDNWKLLAEMLELLDIPQKQEIVDEWRRKFEPIVPKEIIQELENDPALLETVGDIILTKMDGNTEVGNGMQRPGVPDVVPPEPASADLPVGMGQGIGLGGGQADGLPVL